MNPAIIKLKVNDPNAFDRGDALMIGASGPVVKVASKRGSRTLRVYRYRRSPLPRRLP